MPKRFSAIPYRPGHLDFMDTRNTVLSRGDLEVRAEALAKAGTVLTVLMGKTPVAVMGLVPLWKGVGEVWSVMTERVKDKPIAFHKFSKQLLATFEMREKLHRVHCTVRGDFAMGQRWAESLGFYPEGRLIGYGPDGGDYVMYARTN